MEAMSLAAVVVPIVCNGIQGGLPPMPQGRLPSVPRLSVIHCKKEGCLLHPSFLSSSSCAAKSSRYTESNKGGRERSHRGLSFSSEHLALLSRGASIPGARGESHELQ